MTTTITNTTLEVALDRGGRTRNMRSRLAWAGLMAVALAFATGCGESNSLTGDEVPNTPPDTEVTATPPALGETTFTVSFFWTGKDRDGEITGFEWRISDNGEDLIVDVEDTLQTKLPWHYTEATDSTFVVTADLRDFAKDVEDGLSDLGRRFWQTHTFFVRAIDDNGARDPSPAHVSFTATTLAPTVTINLPAVAQGVDCVKGPLALAFGWEGNDPDNPAGDPAEVRYLLLPVDNLASGACPGKADYEANKPISSAPDSLWSDWVAYDAPADSGKVIRFPAAPITADGRSFYFAVQARDVAGAVTPTFVWGRNVRAVQLTKDKFPQLTVTEPFLGEDAFVSTVKIKDFEIASEQTIEFRWTADATPYAGLIEAYRYGFRVFDPNDPNDEGWVVPWGDGPSWRRTQPRKFASGSPNFVVQARDNSGRVSRAVYRFQVIQIARRSEQRNLLVVDDWYKVAGNNLDANLDASQDAYWRDVLPAVKGFQSSDVIDAIDQTSRLTFATVNGYKSVIWYTNQSLQGFFHTRLAPTDGGQPRFNWMDVYQGFVGNVLMVGPSAMDTSLEFHAALDYPVYLDTDRSAPAGLGTRAGTDGERIRIGMERWPYTAWCIETIDIARPTLQAVWGETAGNRLRQKECAEMVYAAVSPQFYSDLSVAGNQVVALRPTPLRRLGTAGPSGDEANSLRLEREEFYNRNITSRAEQINIRSCQTPMFTWISRRDADNAEFMVWNPVQFPYNARLAPPDSTIFAEFTNPNAPRSEANCSTSQRGQVTELHTGAPTALVSHVYARAGTKQNGEVNSPDFLWGFNPIGFEKAGIRAALRWMLLESWSLNDN